MHTEPSGTETVPHRPEPNGTETVPHRPRTGTEELFRIVRGRRTGTEGRTGTKELFRIVRGRDNGTGGQGGRGMSHVVTVW